MHAALALAGNHCLKDPTGSRRLALAAAACAAWPWLAGAAQDVPDEPAVNRRAWPRALATPALQLPLLDGQLWSLAAHKGKPVLLNFWASWCEPCRSEMPALEQLASIHQARGLQLMAVNFKESEATVLRFLQATGLKLPVLRDADGAAARAFGVHIFPTTVAINRQGRAVFSVAGECDWGSAAVGRWVSELL
jgi:thiol-disulfide isomerase/thioredoxin